MRRLEALSELDDALRNLGRSLSSLLFEELLDEFEVLSSELDVALRNFGRSGSSLLLEELFEELLDMWQVIVRTGTGPAQLGTVTGGGGAGRVARRTGGRWLGYGFRGIVGRLRCRCVLFERTFLDHRHGLGFVITFVVPGGADPDMVTGLEIADRGFAAGSVGVFGGTGDRDRGDGLLVGLDNDVFFVDFAQDSGERGGGGLVVTLDWGLLSAPISSSRIAAARVPDAGPPIIWAKPIEANRGAQPAESELEIGIRGP